ncbi:crispr-associated protein cas1 [Heliomicrobium modesticaldum Ice1]|uniref:CRISPR-associated endonuclease Cas1 n=1 Tax=Heliobacterium modesticaldum (strain ATCC 51547 / Ice1) TaxID=498761 RepID=B0TDU2_HELMI|nr:type I-E CRISPR-associated endonuclease Cas1e [Heliomicrobium modesticaldum]ABZ82805.1 crispr-associated protein cas1 [Heliomicrobium modesticaldum Ice1]
MRDLHELPRLTDSISYLYVEHAVVEQEAKAIALWREDGKVQVPCASLSVLMLGPGTKVSHAAMRTLADCGCSVLWVGEGGLRVYGQGMGETRSSSNLLRQVSLWSNPDTRMAVVRRMYELRFREPVSPEMTLRQIRGMEGGRVRQIYARLAKEHGVVWTGRNYDRGNWNSADPVNRALSAANACLYGVCHAAIVSMGYSPAVGFIHTGKQLSFVYDVADIYKTDTTIPVAFTVAGKNDVANIEREVRLACRQQFHDKRLLERVAKDLSMLFSGINLPEVIEGYDGSDDKPGGIWDDQDGIVSGGKNYSDE